MTRNDTFARAARLKRLRTALFCRARCVDFARISVKSHCSAGSITRGKTKTSIRFVTCQQCFSTVPIVLPGWMTSTHLSARTCVCCTAAAPNTTWYRRTATVRACATVTFYKDIIVRDYTPYVPVFEHFRLLPLAAEAKTIPNTWFGFEMVTQTFVSSIGW